MTITRKNAEDIVTRGLVPTKKMPEFGHCMYVSHKISGSQAQNEALVPSLSKEGRDQRAAESVCSIPITPMSCICLALKYGWLKGWTVSRPFLQYVYFGKTNHYKTEQLPPPRPKKGAGSGVWVNAASPLALKNRSTAANQ